MSTNRILWAATRSQTTAPHTAALDGIAMSAFGAVAVLGMAKANADAAYPQGDPSAWSPPV